MTELRALAAAQFGDAAEVVDQFDERTVDVPAERWIDAVTWARDDLGHTYFDWLTAVDEVDAGFDIVVCLWRLPLSGSASAGGEAIKPGANRADRLLLRTRIPRASARLASLTSVFAGASWAERETYEMFGIEFDGHPNLIPLLLPDGFEGNPLRKEFVLASRVVRPWPGAKEPGESDADVGADVGASGGPRPGARRRTVPPGLPDPSWGPRPPGEPSD